MKTIDLTFVGYYREVKKDRIPSVSGIYCVYSCDYNKEKGKVTLNKLLYIGESDNVHDRIVSHDRLNDWKRALAWHETICYSYAEVSKADRERAEAALIFKKQPPFNSEHAKEFIYEDTEIKTNGENRFLYRNFTVKKGDIR